MDFCTPAPTTVSTPGLTPVPTRVLTPVPTPLKTLVPTPFPSTIPTPILEGKDDGLVIFRQRAGCFYLGMPLTELRTILGKPDLVNPVGENEEYHQYNSEGLAFTIRKKNDVIYSITLLENAGSGYIFENGCTMEMDYNRMISCFGSPDSSREVPGKTFYEYDQLCISVEIMINKVTEITLWK